MAFNTIDAKMLAKMFLAGAKNLESKKEWINELNVFPVPDGDTGTNMTLTIMSAAKEVVALGEDAGMEAICKAISGGSLRGARGNSGVILSQLLRGFTKSIKTLEILDIPAIADAFDKAVETAYKAVMKPKEGTILTVARGMAEKSRELVSDGTDDLDVFLKTVIEHGRYVLSQTPELLPVLKQAGVVDSGGQGLMEAFSGAYDAFLGKEIDYSISETPKKEAGAKPEAQEEVEIKFGYCTEFIILLNKTFNIKQEMDFKAFLESIGDSIVCVADEDVVKVHVHTNDPGLAIQRALKYGALSNMKIDNMRLEHQEKLFKEAQKEQAAAEQVPPAERKAAGFVAVSIGDGMNEIFKGLGVDYIIEGGQTMNPSTEDILCQINRTPAETVLVLPNNKNIIMAAQQAGPLTDKHVIVVPTASVPEGVAAMLNFDPDADPQALADAMTEAAGNVETVQITYAARNSDFDGAEIHEGDYIAFSGKKLLSDQCDETSLLREVASYAAGQGKEFLTIYYGEGVDEARAQEALTIFEQACPGCEVTLVNGGQPVYYYLISLE